MREMSDTSKELNDELLRRGYDEGFCYLIALNLNTEYTARRMLGYLKYYNHPKEEDITDEMLSILSDRNRFIQKKEMEYYQAKINELYYYGLGVEDDDD